MARKLAARLEYGCLATDDLGMAIGAVTTVQSHPALHAGIVLSDVFAEDTPTFLALARVFDLFALWPSGVAKKDQLEIQAVAEQFDERRIMVRNLE